MRNSLLLVGIVMFLLIAAVTMAWWVRNRDRDERTWDDYIHDIRAMNEYNAQFVAAIVIFLGFALLDTRVAVPDSSLRMLLIAFTSGAIAMFFFPIRRPLEGGSPGLSLKGHWLLKVLASQATVVFSVFGIWGIIREAI